MRIRCSLVLLVFAGLAVAGDDPDHIFALQRSFYSAYITALGGAGSALRQDISGVYLNPAFSYSLKKENPKAHGTVLAAYGRDSLFEKHTVFTGGTYAVDDGAMGLFYRYVASADDRANQEIILNMAGMLFDKVDQQGPVDMGVNIRYERTKWPLSGLDPLPHAYSWYNSSGKKIRPDSLFDSSAIIQGKLHDQRLSVDLGFLQTEVSPNFDFSLVLKNLLGYQWIRQRPDTIFSIDTVSADTVIQTRTTRTYNELEYDRSSKWLAGRYKTLVVGIAYSYEINKETRLTIPADLEVFGLFDRKLTNRFSLHSGMQLMIRDAFYLRLGYAKAPGTIMRELLKLKNIDQVAFGGGVILSRALLNFYINKDAWGMNLSIDFSE